MSIGEGDVLEVVVKLNAFSTCQIRNVYHLVCTVASALSDAEIVEFLAMFFDNMYGEIAGILSNNIAAEGIHVENITTERVMGDSVFIGTFTGGTASAETYALGVAAVIRMMTSAKGVQGRKFIGALVETAVNDDALLTLTVMSDLLDFAAYMLMEVDLGVGRLQFRVYNRIKQTVTAITEVVVNAIPGYQRRRKQNVGI